MVDWEPQERDVDQHSFEDSERFEDDSLCSWLSEHESVCTNWRGWKRPSTGRTVTSLGQRRDNDSVLSLVEICARQVAAHIPFEVVERMYPPVPEQIQLRITYWSFPDSEEDIRLYSCLANGSADEFFKGEQIFKSGGVRDPLQIGFHLSARVSHTSYKGQYSVAVTFDRKRISGCTCTCDANAAWCSHIVAVCLQRIHQASSVCLRAPVSESLSRLSRDQLQKFAQYLISELSHEMLPTAQHLLDDLLSGKPSRMNLACGAPDPTAGASIYDLTSWCLDQRTLHENIHKILIKFCMPSPTVFSDVNCLSSSAPPVATEWTSLLRPLRGREPEGLWNLLSIVREMFRRHDRNAVPLLEIITEECLRCDQIVIWWVNTRLQLQLGGNAGMTHHHHNHNHNNHHNQQQQQQQQQQQLGNKSQSSSNSLASQHACASLCDEVVVLWRLAALSPKLSQMDREQIRGQFIEWHLAVLETYKSKNQAVSASSAASSSQQSSRRQQADLDVFGGFKPAIEACDLSWTNYRLDSRLGVETERISHAEPCCSQQCSLIQSSEAVLSLQARAIADTAGNRSSVSSEGFCEPEEPDSTVQPAAEASASVSTVSAANESALLAATSGFDRDITVSDKDRVLSTLRPITDQWALLMARAEGLHAHGFTREACRIGVQLAQQLLANPPDFTLDQPAAAGAVSGSGTPSAGGGAVPLTTGKKKRRGVNPVLHQLTQQVSTTLCRCAFLCTVLSEQPEHHHLAFRIGLYGLTMCRPPASTKPLEVRLAHQECELLQLLRRIPLTSQQLRSIRDRAEQLCSGRLKSRGPALVPLSLAQFVFDTLVSAQNKSGVGKLPGDEELGFEAAVTTLGLKANVSEAEHPLLCEGTRRQRGDLAIALLFHYKDNEQKLAKIMDRLLDKEVHRIFHTVSLSSFYSGASPPSTTESTAAAVSPHPAPCPPQQQLCESVERLSVSREAGGSQAELSVRPRAPPIQRRAGWECSELSGLDGEVQGAGAEPGAESRSADNSPTLSRRGWVKSSGPGSDSGSSVKSSDSTGSCNPANMAASSSAGGAGGVSRGGEVPLSAQPSVPSPQCVREPAMMSAGGVAAMSRPYPSLTPESLLSRPIVPTKSARFKSKKMYPSIPNQPSEAAAHFMFELAKNVLAKAGGNSSTSLFTQPSDNGINRGPHRALQVCAFQIGLYALGLHNCVTPNWLSRTYSTNVSWITGQAIELGTVAVLFLCDTWQGHLTPPEAAHIADCSSRSPDQSVVRAAAALALSVLPHAHALNQSEIQRALLQCREQSVQLLEKACLAVEAASKGGGVYPEVLFSIASKWFELYERTCSSGGSGVSSGQEESAATGDMSVLLESSHVIPSPSLHQMVAEPLQVPAQVHLSVTPGTHYPVTYGCTQVGMNQVSVQMYVPCSSQQYPAALQVHYPGVQNPLLVTTGVPPRPQLPPPPPPMVSGPNVPLYSLSHQAPPQMVMFTPPQHHRSPHVHHGHHMRPPPASHLIVPVTLAPSGGVPVNQQPPPPPPRPTTSQPPPPTAATTPQLPPTPLKYLLSAYRVGVLALDTLSRHAHDERGAKFCRTPPYAEDVQWLLQVAMKLGTQCVHHFVACVISSVFSPFILCNLAMEVNSYLSRNNTAPPYRSQIVTPLLQQCQQMFFSCMHVRLCHLTPPEYDDFVGIVCSARHAFSLTNSLPQLQEFLQSHRRHKSLKKELWQRISSIMQQPPPSSHSAAV